MVQSRAKKFKNPQAKRLSGFFIVQRSAIKGSNQFFPIEILVLPFAYLISLDAQKAFEQIVRGLLGKIYFWVFVHNSIFS